MNNELSSISMCCKWTVYQLKEFLIARGYKFSANIKKARLKELVANEVSKNTIKLHEIPSRKIKGNSSLVDIPGNFQDTSKNESQHLHHQRRISLSSLSPEILLRIASMLPVLPIMNLVAASKVFYIKLGGDSFWKYIIASRFSQLLVTEAPAPGYKKFLDQVVHLRIDFLGRLNEVERCNREFCRLMNMSEFLIHHYTAFEDARRWLEIADVWHMEKNKLHIQLERIQRENAVAAAAGNIPSVWE